MSKYEDTRIVTFKEDFSRPKQSGGVKVYYKKNTTHAFHKKIVKMLADQGAKMEVKELDLKKVYAERKKKLLADRERQAKAAYTQ